MVVAEAQSCRLLFRVTAEDSQAAAEMATKLTRFCSLRCNMRCTRVLIQNIVQESACEAEPGSLTPGFKGKSRENHSMAVDYSRRRYQNKKTRTRWNVNT